jgi:hypothetical protein
LPESASVLLDAAEGFRIASWLRAGLGRSQVEPNTLDKFHQELLRGAFASIQALVELTTSHFGLD